MKVILFGLGSIGKRHSRIITKLYPNCNIYAYRSHKKEENSENENIKYVYDIEEAFLHKPEVAFITNPTSLHIDMALIAAKMGCDLFIEKPLSNNLNNIGKLINVANDKNLITLMGCNMRFNPIILNIKKYVDEKLFGNVLSFNIICGSYLPEWRPWQDYTKSYSALNKLGGGVVLDLIHEIDYARWIFGDFVKLKSIIGKVSNLKIETEDCADIIVRTCKNVIGSIHLDYYRAVPQRKIEVVFESGVIIGDLINNKLNLVSKEKNEVIDFDFDRNCMYEDQIKYFFNCVKNHKKTFNDVEEGYNILKLALKIKHNALV